MFNNLNSIEQTIVLSVAILSFIVGGYGVFAILMTMRIKSKTLTVPVHKMIGNKKTLIGFLGSSKDHNKLEVKLYPSHALTDNEVFELFGECYIELLQQDYSGKICHFNLVEYVLIPVKGGYNG